MAMNRERNEQKSEFNDRVVAIKRVSKTVKGGRTMRFSALVVVGDGKGRVGVGLGKAGEVPEAIRKGKEAATKNIVTVAIDENQSIPHDFIGTFGSAHVLLKVPVSSRAARHVPWSSWPASRTSVPSLWAPTTRPTSCSLPWRDSPRSVLRKKSRRNAASPLKRLSDKKEDKRMAKLAITLTKSPIGAIPKQRATVEALGLRKMHKTVVMPDNAAVRGMIWHVRHLVTVEEIAD